MSKKTGYRTITYRFRLHCDRMDWLVETKQMYNRVLSFYYAVIQQEPDIRDVPKLQMMRQLELVTIGARGEESSDVKYPIPYEKVPLYFRRAAINDAIRLHKSFYESFHSGKNIGVKMAEKFDASPIYYKGMYKDFNNISIKLKLFNGDRWVWEECSIDTCGRRMPKTEQMMSPVIVLERGRAMLHVPVKEEVEDIRTVKERLDEEEDICAVYFPNSDTMAVMVIMDSAGVYKESRFIRGGKALVHRKKVLLGRIEKNRKSMGCDCENVAGIQIPEDENRKLKEKIRHITDDAAHKVSREIVNFCKARNVGIIVVPMYKEGMDFNRIGYISSTSYDWIGRRIISYIKYKAFGEGIVTATTSTSGIAFKCYQCGQQIKRYNEGYRPGSNFYGGKQYVCPNGHKGNSYFNSAMNVGKNFLKRMTKD